MQVVSAKLKLTEPLPAMVSTLNGLLPKDIRIFGVERTVAGFQARTFCESRVYEYLLPTFVFEKQDDWTLDSIFAAVTEPETKKLKVDEKNDQEISTDKEAAGLEAAEDSETEEANNSASSWIVPESVLRQQSAFRLSRMQLDRLKSVLARFEGIHKFHNYTIGKDANEKNATRQIRSFTVSGPFLIENTNQADSEAEASTSCEWIKLRVHGNSFMLHQIRKFVGKFYYISFVYGLNIYFSL